MVSGKSSKARRAATPRPVTGTEAPPDLSLRPALRALARRDPDIARAYRDCGLPPDRRRPPGFASLMQIIMAQQVSAHSAKAIIDRLSAAADPLTPETFLAFDEDDLKAIGLSRQKMRYGRALSEDVLTGHLDLDGLVALDDDAILAELCRAKGIGRWTAEVYMLFALGRPDVWPAGDLAVQVAVQRLKGLEARPSLAEMDAIAEAWRPYRSAAARFLWHFYRHPGVPDA